MGIQLGHQLKWVIYQSIEWQRHVKLEELGI